MAKKITMKNLQEKTFKDVYDDFVKAKTAQGVTEYTLRNYHHHFKSIEKYIDMNTCQINSSVFSEQLHR